MPNQQESKMVDLGHPKNRRALLITLIVVTGTWLSTVFHYVLGVYWSLPYPYESFLFRSERRFDDFYDDLRRASQFVHGLDVNMPYSPFATTVMSAFSLIPMKRVAFVLAMGAFVLAVTILVWDRIANELRPSLTLRLIVSVVIITMSYPILFALDRGNEEVFVFIAIAGFAQLYFRNKKYGWAAVLLGAAIAYKMYPAVLMVIFIADRRWKPLGISIATYLGLTGLSTMFLGTSSGYGALGVVRHWLFGTFVGHVGLANVPGGHQHGHSLWGVVMVTYRLISGADPTAPMRSAYVVFAFAAFALLSAYIVFVEKDDWRRVTLLIVAMLLLPFESHDYTLIHILIPVAMFANSERNPWDAAFSALFGLLLIPLDYFIVISTVSISSYVFPVVLVAIAALIIAQRFSSPAASSRTDILATP